MTSAQERIEKARELAEFCIKCADDKKAENMSLIKLPETSGVADYFVVATANSDPHLQALANHIERQVRETYSLRIISGENGDHGGWILLDVKDVIVHIMLPEIREKYQLETLWGGTKA